jgi:hypothetical protein
MHREQRRLWWLYAVLFLILGEITMAMAEEVRAVYVGAAESSVWRGVSLGQHEANILGQFTGQTYVVQPMRPEDLLGKELSMPPVVVLAATDVETLHKLSATFAPSGVAVFNLTRDNDALRQACLPNLLHTPPSARMKADAVAQWQKKHPGATVEAWAWHPDFVKYAARDLNKRFRELHHVPMDNDAWAGWAALKMVSEAIARTQTTKPGRILAYLRQEIEFDGQKGVSHTFRETGQLRQPLLIVQDGKIVGEAPVRGVADIADLDSLGLVSCSR